LGDSYASGEVGRHDHKTGKRADGANGTRIKEFGQTRQQSNLRSGLKPKDLVGIPWRVAFALQADGWYLRSDIIWAKPNPMPESVTDRPTKAHEYLFLLTKSTRYFYDAEAIKERGTESSVERAKYGWNGKMEFQPDGTELRSQPDPVDKMGERWCPPNRNKRSVWTVATAPYPEAHFATYPPDLIKPCIMAGTSAKGCCAKCGAPWERIIERGEEKEQRKNWRGEDNAYGVTGGNHAGRTGNWGAESKTLGWKPTCSCNRYRIENKMKPDTNNDEFICEICEQIFDIEDSIQQSNGALLCPNCCGETQTVPCTILDCFAGSGTTGAVALELGRRAILIELNPAYIKLIEQRCDVTMGLALA
jgi:hypothetical protein